MRERHREKKSIFRRCQVQFIILDNNNLILFNFLRTKSCAYVINIVEIILMRSPYNEFYERFRWCNNIAIGFEIF